MTLSVQYGLRVLRTLAQPVRTRALKSLKVPRCWSVQAANYASLEIPLAPAIVEPLHHKLYRFVQELPLLCGDAITVHVYSMGADGRTPTDKSIAARLESRALEEFDLTADERLVVSRRYGWLDGIEHTLGDIAKEMNRSPARIRQIELTACHRLGAYHRKALNISKSDPR